MRNLRATTPGDLVERVNRAQETPSCSVLVAPGLLSHTGDGGYLRGITAIADDLHPQLLVTSFRTGHVRTAQAEVKAGTMLDETLSRHFSHVIILRSSSDDAPEDLAGPLGVSCDGGTVVRSAGFTAIAPGWVAVCAQDSPPTAYPGRHAIGLARGWRTSMVCLGTPQTGIIRETFRRDGVTSELWGIEIGAHGAEVVLLDSGKSPRVLSLKPESTRPPIRRAAA